MPFFVGISIDLSQTGKILLVNKYTFPEYSSILLNNKSLTFAPTHYAFIVELSIGFFIVAENWSQL